MSCQSHPRTTLQEHRRANECACACVGCGLPTWRWRRVDRAGRECAVVKCNTLAHVRVWRQWAVGILHSARRPGSPFSPHLRPAQRHRTFTWIPRASNPFLCNPCSTIPVTIERLRRSEPEGHWKDFNPRSTVTPSPVSPGGWDR